MENKSEKVNYPQPVKQGLLRRIFDWLAKGAEKSASQSGCSS